ncbi:probable protein phosphatase 2C 46 [Vicia villosa]|uniref:probable protein phosphatase 2C 46 n=1 Tax=Vicia villosa TaxID=3911 RepID=UPI00273CDD08|nr:probable protein phosphatase 2C 46 [Vicia villosa]
MKKTTAAAPHLAAVESFVNDNLFSNFKSFAAEDQRVSEKVIKRAFSATGDDFLALVKKQWLTKPQIASSFSSPYYTSDTCYFTGIICNGMLYVANTEDSRVVLRRVKKGTKETLVVQLSAEHNVNIETERNDVRSKHPYNPHIVVMKHSVWRVKGIIHITERVGEVAYRIALPPILANLHDVFQVSQLRKYTADPSLMIQVDDVQVKDNLTVEASPMRIEDRKLKQLRDKEIALVRVAWGGPTC